MNAINIFLIVILFCFSFNISYSQWVDKGEFKEIHIGPNVITNFSAPKNENSFYTLTSDLTLYQYDYNGNLQFRRLLNSRIVDHNNDTCFYKNISKDLKSIIYRKLKKLNNNIKKLYYDVFDVKTEMLLNSYEDSIHQYTKEIVMDYSRENEIFLEYYNNYYSYSGSSNYVDRSSSGVGIIRAKERITYISCGYLYSLVYDENLSRIIINGINSWAKTYNNSVVTCADYYMYYYDNVENKTASSYIHYSYEEDAKKEMKYNLCLANMSNRFVGYDNLNLYSTIYMDKMIYPYEKVWINGVIKEIIFSKYDNYLIYLTNTTIEIINAFTYQKIKTFNINPNDYLKDLRISWDNKGFFVRTASSVRFYEISQITEVENSDLNNRMAISPNPASDFIEISLDSSSIKRGSGGVSYEIFNIVGELQELPRPLGTPSKEGEVRVDISNLAPGVYFIRIGEKFEKFIKI